MNGIIPVNHDTSSSSILIGKCPYKFYHHARATPYCIQVVENLRKHMDLSQACTDEKIYINRRGRRLKNEREVQEYLVKKGFKILDLEYLTLDDQANIFANAAMIIGFHGAGFTNILFSGPRVSIVEIVDADCVYPSYLDGVVIPGKKATRTYFHLLACMKKLNYRVIETRDYQLSLDRLAEILP